MFVKFVKLKVWNPLIPFRVKVLEIVELSALTPTNVTVDDSKSSFSSPKSIERRSKAPPSLLFKTIVPLGVLLNSELKNPLIHQRVVVVRLIFHL